MKNEQGYMVVKLLICIKNVLLYLHSSTKIQLSGKLRVRQIFVKEADGVISYFESSMEIVGG